MRRLPDILVTGQERWDEIERRNQLLVRALAGRNPRTRFLFSELPGRRPRRLRSVAPNVFVVCPGRPLPDRIGLCSRLNDRLEAAQLRRAVRRTALESPALWTQDPRAAMLVAGLPAGTVIYDLTDDWPAFERDERRRRRVQARVDSLLRRADVVLACSQVLAERARPLAPHVQLVPNAVEPGSPSRLAQIGLPRPVLGYAGTLHDARLDVDLLARAAALRPSWSFALLGPDQLGPESRRRLDALPNVHLLDPVPHERVREVVEAFDVCLVPHVVTAFTRSLDPLKLYEYLAAGRPVVATPAGYAPGLAAHVLEAADASELVSRAEEALASDGPEAARARRAAVAGETWEARAGQVERLVGVRPGPAEGPRPQVSVVVVSRDTRELLARCLLALGAQRGVSLETIVVDNGSSDGSPALVRERFPEAHVLELRENAGFARATNAGLGRSRGEYVLMLNSDAFLAPGALAALLAAAERRPAAGALGPRLLNEDGTLQRSAWPFPSAGRILLEALLLHRPLRRAGLLEDLGTWAHDRERAVDFLAGACLLVRREALEEAGGLDERFFLYGEEADLCRRIARRGWEVVLVPDAVAVHVGAASSPDELERLLRFYRGQKTYLRKHGRPGSWPVARAALLAGALLRGRWRVAAVALDPRL